MLLALQLGELIACQVQEILVGREDGAIRLTLDDRVRLAESCELATQFGELGGIQRHPGGLGRRSRRGRSCVYWPLGNLCN